VVSVRIKENTRNAEVVSMNILIIGNGFDLAHELPTTYMDFLFFCCIVRQLIKGNKIEGKIPKDIKDYREWLKDKEEVVLDIEVDKDSCIQDFLLTTGTIPSERNENVYINLLNNFIERDFLGKDKNQELMKEVLYLVHDNFWISYFLQCNMHDAKNWIDFESEISNIIKSVDKVMHDPKYNYSIYDKITEWPKNYLEPYFKDNKEMTFKELRDCLVEDLNKLIRAFEIYLAEYVEKIEIRALSPSINGIVYFNRKDDAGNVRITSRVYNKVLSFNYTNTYEKVYLRDCTCDLSDIIDYIHGKADINNTIENNNMVLGMDEYLKKKKRNKQLEFIAFKKFYQRIHKETGCKYKEWTDEIKKENDEYEEKFKESKENPPRHNLYIFGHSLDVTDKEILKELILTKYMHTTIFYRNLEQKGQQIANLVKVIGQGELIRRTGGGSARTIKFELQKPKENRKI